MRDRAFDALRILAGAGLTAGLVAVGLALAGPGVGALTAARPSADAALAADDLRVRSGEVVGRQALTVNGRPTQVALCRTALAPGALLALYRGQAAAETPRGQPYLLEEDAGGGSLLWVTAAGVHKAVLAASDGEGGAVYRLVVDRSRDRLAPADAPLPGGLAPLPGFQVSLALGSADGTGLLLLEAPGGGPEVTGLLLAELEARGYRPDARAHELYSALAGERQVIPFTHVAGGLAGHLTVTVSQAGARASLAFRRTG